MKLTGLAKKLQQEENNTENDGRGRIKDDSVLFNGNYIPKELYRRLNPVYFSRRARKLGLDYFGK